MAYIDHSEYSYLEQIFKELLLKKYLCDFWLVFVYVRQGFFIFTLSCPVIHHIDQAGP